MKFYKSNNPAVSLPFNLLNVQPDSREKTPHSEALCAKVQFLTPHIPFQTPWPLADSNRLHIGSLAPALHSSFHSRPSNSLPSMTRSLSSLWLSLLPYLPSLSQTSPLCSPTLSFSFCLLFNKPAAHHCGLLQKLQGCCGKLSPPLLSISSFSSDAKRGPKPKRLHLKEICMQSILEQ